MTGFPSYLRKAGYFCTNNVKTDYNTSNSDAIIKASWDTCSAKAHWRERKPGQPFFAIFNDMVTHQSRSMVYPYEQFRQEVQSLLPPERHHDPAKAPVPPYYPDTPIIRRTIARNYDCISVMDNNTGRILKQLEEDGLADERIFQWEDAIISLDHIDLAPELTEGRGHLDADRTAVLHGTFAELR